MGAKTASIRPRTKSPNVAGETRPNPTSRSPKDEQEALESFRRLMTKYGGKLSFEGLDE
jgi:hypothetical protein